jgi:type IV secretory pathway ATPase VirB11/archaellum biosynthesis ATPase
MSYYHPLNSILSHIQYLKLSYAYVAGGTGSGKTTVVHQIMNELPDKRSRHHIQDSTIRKTTTYPLTNVH